MSSRKSARRAPVSLSAAAGGGTVGGLMVCCSMVSRSMFSGSDTQTETLQTF